ncbi:MAG TPA: response regulator [Longimicrobiales bacterium]|nr:response regulator [Longimicrobiales bacterium]
MAQQLVLIADDNPDALLIFETILEARGFAVIHAVDGDEAVELARQHRPDLIFMDLMMPGTDGWEAMAVLRQDPDVSSRIPVVAVSAYEPAREDVREAGFCALLIKPVKPTEVVRAAKACLDAHDQGQSWIADLSLRVRSE